MEPYDIEKLSRLLAALPPPPSGWVEAAQQLPESRRAIDTLVAQAEADAELRERILADLEAAVERSGIRATPRVLEEVRMRLRSF